MKGLIVKLKVTFALIIISSCFVFSQNVPILPDTVLNTERIDEIKFNSSHFTITANLYLPKTLHGKTIPVVIWVSGSGPSYRTVKSPETKKLVNRFLNAGYAYFRIDKPGYGDSKGNVNDDSLFAQLSDVVVNAVNELKKLPFINSKRIGLFGSSQAGYIMPLAVSKCKDISFIIGSSCPGENSVDQWNYLLEKQMLCEGYSIERASKNIEMFSVLRETTDKKKFDAAVDYFKKNPMIVKSLNYDSTFSEKAKKWWSDNRTKTGESYFNPIELIKKIKILIFMVYGNFDTQIDPIQAIEAYKKALHEAGNKYYRIKMLQGVDHNMFLTNTGCLKEISERGRSNNYSISSAYLDTITEWLKELESIE